MEKLGEIIESILFIAGEPVLVSDISSKLGVEDKEIKTAIKNLKSKFNEDSGLVLLEFNGKLQLATNSKYGEAVSMVLNPIRERSLSKATLETLAIIAYKQPITRLEIEEIRGVGCDYAISILMDHNLIEVVGRKDAVGRPVLFGTTDDFLKRFNISNLADLPDYNDLLEKIKIVRTNDDALYNEYDVPTSKIENDEELKPNEQEDIKLPNVKPIKEVAIKNEKPLAESTFNPDKNYFNDIIKEDDEDELISSINSQENDDEIV
ncbi:MAG: SMC-Scp complex subunit ScpB [Clostridia bacterium]|nr:SMC-Scp complex subunit ScpB [Clostridia bacterium]